MVVDCAGSVKSKVDVCAASIVEPKHIDGQRVSGNRSHPTSDKHHRKHISITLENSIDLIESFF